MDLKVISNEDYDLIISKIDEILTILKDNSNITRNPLTELWITNAELMRSLNTSARTLQYYRDTRILAYTKIGNKIYYRSSDVEKLLEDNYTG